MAPDKEIGDSFNHECGVNPTRLERQSVDGRQIIDEETKMIVEANTITI